MCFKFFCVFCYNLLVGLLALRKKKNWRKRMTPKSQKRKGWETGKRGLKRRSKKRDPLTVRDRLNQVTKAVGGGWLFLV